MGRAVGTVRPPRSSAAVVIRTLGPVTDTPQPSGPALDLDSIGAGYADRGGVGGPLLADLGDPATVQSGAFVDQIARAVVRLAPPPSPERLGDSPFDDVASYEVASWRW